MKIKKLCESLSFILNHPLNRDRKLQSLHRWLIWQFKSRLTNKPIEVPFVNHSKLSVRSGMMAGTGNIYCGLQEFESMSFALHLLRPDDLFFDIGANIGTYSILAATLGTKCFSFEPIHESYEVFCKNIKLNDFDGLITPYLLALSSQPGSVQMSTDMDAMNSVIPGNEPHASAGVTSVACDTLDHAAGDLCPTLIKIDVEGHEPQVLHGARSILTERKPLAFILEVNSAETHQIMLAHSYKPFKYYPFERKLESLPDFDSNSLNTLYIENISLAEERVKSAAAFSVFDRKI